MFTKFIIFLAVACTLTLASSTEEKYKYQQLVRRQTRGIFGTLGSWISSATSAVTYPYRKVFDILVQTGQGFADYGSEKVQQLAQKYNDIKSAYQKNVDEIKNEIIRRAIGELQNMVNALAHGANIETCEDVKQSNQNLAESGKEALDKLEQDLQDAVDAELKNLEDELANWQIEADNVVKENEKKSKKTFKVRSDNQI